MYLNRRFKIWTKFHASIYKEIIELIDLKKGFEDVDSDSFKYNRRSLPISKIFDTLLMLAEVISFRRKSEEALKLFDYVQKGFNQLFGTDNSLRNSYIEQ